MGHVKEYTNNLRRGVQNIRDGYHSEGRIQLRSRGQAGFNMALIIPHLSKENCLHRGTGPETSVLLAMLHVGLGAVMNALPAIWQLKEDGNDVTVNCREFQRPIFEALGVTVTTEREPFGMAWTILNNHRYGRVYSLAAWDIWQCREFGYQKTGSMECLAEILGVTLPETFSWIDILKPEIIPGDPYILFAPNAIEKWRSVPLERLEALGEIVSQFGEVVQLNGEECDTWEELRDIIFSASSVVTVEGGVANVAGALGKTLVCLQGLTDVENYVGQNRKYIPELQLYKVSGFQPDGCSLPCWRDSNRGFKNDRCLGKHDLPECMVRMDFTQIREHFLTIQNHE